MSSVSVISCAFGMLCWDLISYDMMLPEEEFEEEGSEIREESQ
jgi:hypothetical protein